MAREILSMMVAYGPSDDKGKGALVLITVPTEMREKVEALLTELVTKGATADRVS